MKKIISLIVLLLTGGLQAPYIVNDDRIVDDFDCPVFECCLRTSMCLVILCTCVQQAKEHFVAKSDVLTEKDNWKMQ